PSDRPAPSPPLRADRRALWRRGGAAPRAGARGLPDRRPRGGRQQDRRGGADERTGRHHRDKAPLARLGARLRRRRRAARPDRRACPDPPTGGGDRRPRELQGEAQAVLVSRLTVARKATGTRYSAACFCATASGVRLYVVKRLLSAGIGQASRWPSPGRIRIIAEVATMLPRLLGRGGRQTDHGEP